MDCSEKSLFCQRLVTMISVEISLLKPEILKLLYLVQITCDQLGHDVTALTGSFGIYVWLLAVGFVPSWEPDDADITHRTQMARLRIMTFDSKNVDILRGSTKRAVLFVVTAGNHTFSFHVQPWDLLKKSKDCDLEDLHGDKLQRARQQLKDLNRFKDELDQKAKDLVEDVATDPAEDVAKDPVEDVATEPAEHSGFKCRLCFD